MKISSVARTLSRVASWQLLLILLALPVAAQVTVSVVSGTTETPIPEGGRFLLGTYAAGDTNTILLRIRNPSIAPLQITRYTALGSGFTLIAPNAPFTMAGNAFRDAVLHFSPTSAAGYSANLQVNAFTATLLAMAVAAPELSVFPVCTGSNPLLVLFGNVFRGQARTCNFNLHNPGAQPMLISSFSVTGGGFALTDASARTVPFTLAAGQTISFAVQFSNNQVGVKTGVLQIETQAYTLTATSLDGPLPAPLIEFTSTGLPVASAQQRMVTLRLPSPAPFTSSGVIRMSLLPDSALVTDDAAVVFLNGLRQMTFTVQEGSSAIFLDGQTSAVFQTGTTAGRIRFSLSGIATGFTTDPTTDLVIPRTPVLLDRVQTGRLEAFLYLTVTGFDNTSSAGVMSFSFYDVNGRLIQTVPANFADEFKAFFTGTRSGGVFHAALQFPVTKAAEAVKAVEIEVTNAAGTTRTGRFAFQ